MTQEDALKKIAKPIFNGDLDYLPDIGKKKKIALITFIIISSGYLAYESAKLYMKIGGDGTEYLPVGNFSKEQGSLAAFGCNAALNWYVILDTTLLDIRKAYLHYQLRKKLGVPMSYGELGKSIAKQIIAFGLALTAGIVFALVAKNDSKQSEYNQFVTACVNTLLNFIGSIALITLSLYLTKKCYKNATKKTEAEEILKVLNEEKDDFFKNTPKDSESFSERIYASEKKPILVGETKKKSCYNYPLEIATQIKNRPLSFLSHVTLQVCDKIALIGYFLSTVKSAGGKIGPPVFCVFLALSSKLVYETTKEMVDLSETAVKKLKRVKKEDISLLKTREFYKKLPFIIIPAGLILLGYFVSYISSNSSLELNAKYAGLKQYWNTIPTAIGSAAFNGFAFLQIIMSASKLAMEYGFLSKDTRDVLDRKNKLANFLSSNPDIIEEMIKKNSKDSVSLLTYTP